MHYWCYWPVETFFLEEEESILLLYLSVVLTVRHRPAQRPQSVKTDDGVGVAHAGREDPVGVEEKVAANPAERPLPEEETRRVQRQVK